MKFSNFYKYLTERHKLSLRNIRTGREIWHVFTSRLSLVLSLLGLIGMMLIAVILTVAYTPVMDLIPGYPGSKARKMIVDNISRLDSLDNQIREWELYNRELRFILEGNVIPTTAEDSAKVRLKGTILPRSASDSLLRIQMESDSAYMLVAEARKRNVTTFEMLAPIRGKVIKAFSPGDNVRGVEIAPEPNKGILTILDGTVTMTTWNPQDGNVIVIQHAANMVSIYKKVAQPICQIGQRVKAGEAIGMTGEAIAGRMPHLVFEIWNNGNAVDPEAYITF